MSDLNNDNINETENDENIQSGETSIGNEEIVESNQNLKNGNEKESNEENSDDEIHLPLEKDTLLQSVYDEVEKEYDSSDNEMLNTNTTSSSGIFKVSSTSSKMESQIEKEKRLTSKQRRAIERASKRKKVGSNFYEVTNVKK